MKTLAQIQAENNINKINSSLSSVQGGLGVTLKESNTEKGVYHLTAEAFGYSCVLSISILIF